LGLGFRTGGVFRGPESLRTTRLSVATVPLLDAGRPQRGWEPGSIRYVWLLVRHVYQGVRRAEQFTLPVCFRILESGF